MVKDAFSYISSDPSSGDSFWSFRSLTTNIAATARSRQADVPAPGNKPAIPADVTTSTAAFAFVALLPATTTGSERFSASRDLRASRTSSFPDCPTLSQSTLQPGSACFATSAAIASSPGCFFFSCQKCTAFLASSALAHPRSSFVKSSKDSSTR